MKPISIFRHYEALLWLAISLPLLPAIWVYAPFNVEGHLASPTSWVVDVLIASFAILCMSLLLRKRPSRSTIFANLICASAVLAIIAPGIWDAFTTLGISALGLSFAVAHGFFVKDHLWIALCTADT
jgi:hypothetical protein